MRNPWGRGGHDGQQPPEHGRNGEHNGAQPEGMLTQPIVFDELPAQPVDFLAIQADDELLNAIAAGRPITASSTGHSADDRISAMLQAWRDEVTAEPLRPLITVEQADAALRAGRRAVAGSAAPTSAAGRPRHSATAPRRHLIPLAGAAAALAITLSGVALGAQGAEPGDALWTVSKVLYSERAASVEKKVEVESRLQRVRKALVEGRTEDARRELAAASTDLTAVRSQEGKEQLAEQQAFLAQKLDATPPGTAVDPSELGTPGSNPSTVPSSSVPPSSSIVPSSTSSVPVPPPPADSQPASAPPQSSGGTSSPTTSA